MSKWTLRAWQLALLVGVFLLWHVLTAPGLLPPFFSDDRQAAFFSSWAQWWASTWALRAGWAT